MRDFVASTVGASTAHQASSIQRDQLVPRHRPLSKFGEAADSEPIITSGHVTSREAEDKVS